MQHQMTKLDTSYLTETDEFDNAMSDALAEASAQGWELVSSEIVKADGTGTTVLLFWKKP